MSEQLLISLFFQAIRKSHGLSQVEFAQKLEISQAQISKIEKFKKKCDLELWIRFVNKFDILFESIRYGIIFYTKMPELNVISYDHSSFNISSKYLRNMGSTAKTCKPFIDIALNNLGVQKTIELLKKLGVELGYFFIASNQINILFLHDLVLELSRLRLLKLNKGLNVSLDEFKKNFSNIVSALDFQRSESEVLDLWSNELNKSYDVNVNYCQTSEHEVLIKPADHISDFKLSEEFKIFQGYYYAENVNRITSLFSKESSSFETSRLEDSWLIGRSV